MTKRPRVCVIVLNFNGLSDTLACLNSVLETRYSNLEIVVLDNGSDRNEADDITAACSEDRVAVVRSETNLGFAGGVNKMIRETSSDYIVLLNNDTTVSGEWLEQLLEVAGSDEQVAVVQPKILSMRHPGYFEYGGAAGGFMDALGFPYCRGRVGLDTEEDRGQYDEQVDLFWGSAACLLLRRRAVVEAGGLAEDFFFYHEETDLCWRLKNLGYRIAFAPRATIFHKGSGSSMKSLHRKIFFVHRNALMMAVRNCTAARLCWLLPIRVVIEMMSMGFYALTGRPRLSLAVLRADLAFLVRVPKLLRDRKELGGDRRIATAEMWPASVLWQYFIRRKRTYSQIHGRPAATTSLRRDSFLAGSRSRRNA